MKALSTLCELIERKASVSKEEEDRFLKKVPPEFLSLISPETLKEMVAIVSVDRQKIQDLLDLQAANKGALVGIHDLSQTLCLLNLLFEEVEGFILFGSEMNKKETAPKKTRSQQEPVAVLPKY